MSGILQLRNDSGRLLFPGVAFESNKLVINEELEGETLKELIRFLIPAESSSLFWFGDCLAWLKAKKGEEFAIEVAGQSDNADRAWDAMIVCERLQTRFNVSFQHHKEAIIESGMNVAVAATWLQKAQYNNWTISQMRREMRQSHRIVAKEPIASGSVTITGEISRLKSKMRVILQERPLREWSAEEVAGLRLDLEPVARLIGDVERQYQELLSA